MIFLLVMDGNLIWLSIIVLLSYTTQAMSGFGSTILAVTLGLHLYPLEVLLPVLVALDLLVNLYLVTRHFRYINRPHLFRSILPAMGCGLLAGIIAFHYIEGVLLKKLFGLLVILLSMRELYRLLHHRPGQTPLSYLAANACILVAGIVHGIYASGGPLLIYAVSRLNLSKSAFRSTLAAVWFIFSVVLIAAYLMAGTFNIESLRLIFILLPMILIGIKLGEWLHHRIDENRFRLFVFIVLFIAGLSICIS